MDASRCTLTLFHTSAADVPRFDALLSSAPGVSVRHVVRESLLAAARARCGVDAGLTGELEDVLRSLSATAAVILCTCSTLGAAAEAFDGVFGARVLRVDRPLAGAAVARGSRIVVVAALGSTLEPTRALLEDEAARAGKTVSLTLSLCEGAWGHFERGDEDGYLRAVAAHADRVAHQGEVIVLAQASMAGAEAFVRDPQTGAGQPAAGAFGGAGAALEYLRSSEVLELPFSAQPAVPRRGQPLRFLPAHDITVEDRRAPQRMLGQVRYYEQVDVAVKVEVASRDRTVE